MSARPCVFALLWFLIALMPVGASHAQEGEPSVQEKEDELTFDKERQEALFKQTYWTPKRGVMLLKTSSAIKAWRRMRKKSCELPELKSGNVFALKGFRTDHLYIFAFETFHDVDWVVCHRKTGNTEFRAAGISAGYKDGDPKKPFDQCGLTFNTTSARFQAYTTDGPLFFEVLMSGCRNGSSYHEFLFHLDESELVEVPGSRTIMFDYFNRSDEKRGWVWWPPEKHVRLGEIKWTGDGELKWTRTLEKVPVLMTNHVRSDDSFVDKKAKYELVCQYSKAERSVDCVGTLIKSGRLKFKNFQEVKESSNDTERYSKLLKHIDFMKELGYEIKPAEMKKLKDAATREKSK